MISERETEQVFVTWEDLMRLLKIITVKKLTVWIKPPTQDACPG